VPVIFRKRALWVPLVALFLSSPARAQQFGVGVTYGWVNDVSHDWELGQFNPHDWQGWFEVKLEDNVITRASFGSILVGGSTVGDAVVIGGAPTTVPYYSDTIGYATLDASYIFRMGPVNSGLFGGIGGYRVSPEQVLAVFKPYRDAPQTVFGWNVGVDGDIHVYRGLSAVGRVTFHALLTNSNRYLLVASVGAVYRF
jgi:hypothetical protein